MIDKNNLVRTLAGAPLGSPNGISPLLARFVNIGDVKYANAESEDRIIVHDAGDKRIRDFAMGGLTLETRAGNQTCGLIDLEIDAFNQPLSECSDFVPSRLQVEIDKSRIFFSTGPNRLSALEGNTWQNLSNGFVDGPNVIAIKDSHILLGHNGPNGMGYLSTYNFDTTSVTDILFNKNITSPVARNENFCDDDVSLDSCSPWFTLGNMHGQYDAVTDQWIIPDQTQGRVVAIDASGNGPIRTFTTFERPARDIALDRSLDLTSNLIYYCAENGELHKLDLTTMSDGHMSFPITGMKCNGQIQMLKQRNTLLFSYIQNGLQGVAE